MKTIVTNLSYLLQTNVKEMDLLDKSDKLIVLYQESEQIPVSVCSKLNALKIKPIFREIPKVHDGIDENLSFMFSLGLTLGSMLASCNGIVALLTNDEHLKNLDGLKYAEEKNESSIKVFDTFKAISKLSDKPSRKRSPRSPKNNATEDPVVVETQFTENSPATEERTKELIDEFEKIVNQCNDFKYELSVYLSDILLSVQESTDVVGLEIRMAVNMGKDAGLHIYSLIKGHYKRLKEIASEIAIPLE